MAPKIEFDSIDDVDDEIDAPFGGNRAARKAQKASIDMKRRHEESRQPKNLSKKQRRVLRERGEF